MAGNETVTLRADDGRGRTSDISVRFTVLPAGPEIGGAGAGPAWDPLAPLDIVAGSPVSHSVPAAVDPSATYSVVGGLPHGLSFKATARMITGMSGSAGFKGVLLRATDSGGSYMGRGASGE